MLGTRGLLGTRIGWANTKNLANQTRKVGSWKQDTCLSWAPLGKWSKSSRGPQRRQPALALKVALL